MDQVTYYRCEAGMEHAIIIIIIIVVVVVVVVVVVLLLTYRLVGVWM